jgi:hypothetical protein
MDIAATVDRDVGAVAGTDDIAGAGGTARRDIADRIASRTAPREIRRAPWTTTHRGPGREAA